jgi:hypothetical protein
MTALVGLEQLGRGPYRAPVLQIMQGAIGGEQVSGEQPVAFGLGKRTDALQMPGSQSEEGEKMGTLSATPCIAGCYVINGPSSAVVHGVAGSGVRAPPPSRS